MGQRHQIYFVLPSPHRGEKHRIVGLHHQWLYGSQPLRKLQQLLDFVQRGIDAHNTYFMDATVPSWMMSGYTVGNSRDDETTRTLHAVYGIDLDDGGYKSLHTLDDGECQDPRRGDNNDGITIVDLRKPAAPRFAFMFVDAGDPGVDVGDQMVPLSAGTYLSKYYRHDATNDDDGKLAPDGSWQLASKLDKRCKRITIAQLRKLFPAMFAESAAEVE